MNLISDNDIYLFKQGCDIRAYNKLGAHLVTNGEEQGVHFAVWAPNANYVAVVGDFNGWNNAVHPLNARWDQSGIWEGFVPGVTKGALYKFYISSHHKAYTVEKGDPFAFRWETPPKTASMVWDLDYRWQDGGWMASRGQKNTLDAPMSIYEMHLGSWRRSPDAGNASLDYRETAVQLARYLKDMGFTHVEFLPVMEYPFYGSWGYQTIGYFAPTNRYGSPQDFMFLVDHLHQNGIGVILDWVPSHFPGDEHGLAYFDGTHLYEHSDRRKGFHPDWKTCIYNYGRPEVCSFLLSSAIFWLDKYHIDGLRLDAVASMLYLDYSRQEGEWVPNEQGGRENTEAIAFLRRFNETVYREYPGVQTIAEESTSWPAVSRPVDMGGLGFGLKWNMGWMHDTTSYFSKEPVYRKYHHNQLTFSMLYAFHENFILPLSHDEVVYGKGSLMRKFPGDDWQKFANLRLFLGYIYAHPGKNLIFMGSEFGQWDEWYHEKSLDWHLLGNPPHSQIKKWVSDLNGFYRNSPSLYEKDFHPEGFRWVDCDDAAGSMLCFIRYDGSGRETLVAACNFTPVPRQNVRFGFPRPGFWKEHLNSDSEIYGGGGMGNAGGIETESIPNNGLDQSAAITIPPLGIVMFKQKH